MDFDYVMKELSKASPFERYRLTLAIAESLKSEQVLTYFKDRLYPGQIITYISVSDDPLAKCSGCLI